MVDLTSLALVGTARGQAPADLGLFGLGETPERQLLLAAGADAVQRDAGRLAVDAEALEPAPRESLRVLSKTASTLLGGVLRDRDEGLLADALGQMRVQGFVLSPEMLITALGQRAPTLRELLRPVLGERGRWVAQFSDEWGWALEGSTPSTAERDFEDGGPRRRLAALVELRRIDADAARERLAQLWPGLSAEHRLVLLDGLVTGLGPGDEPFLAALGTDRSKRVRQAAARVLARMSGSALSRRMVERARACLDLVLGQGLAIVLPATFAEDWAADGLLEQPPSGVGERAWWLRQIVAHCPLDSLVGDDPLGWLASIPADAPQLLLGVAEAAVLAADASWAERIFDRVPADFDPVLRLKLLQLIPPRGREQRVMRMMRANDLLVASGLEALESPWSHRFAMQWVSSVQAHVGRTGHRPGAAGWATTLRTAARALPPSCFDQASALQVGEVPGMGVWQRERDAMLVTLHFRQSFAAELLFASTDEPSP